jgi:hypothetical protein
MGNSLSADPTTNEQRLMIDEGLALLRDEEGGGVYISTRRRAGKTKAMAEMATRAAHGSADRSLAIAYIGATPDDAYKWLMDVQGAVSCPNYAAYGVGQLTGRDPSSTQFDMIIVDDAPFNGMAKAWIDSRTKRVMVVGTFRLTSALSMWLPMRVLYYSERLRT